MTGMIRTIGGDLPSDLAGPTYTHEHLIIDSPLVAETMPHIHLGSVDEGRAEVEPCIAAGVRTMVDAMPAGSGRDPDKLARISVLTGMRVVAATGLHTDKLLPGRRTGPGLSLRINSRPGSSPTSWKGSTVSTTGVRR